MNRSTFADGMLLNAILIFAGVIFLIWVSTLADNDIAQKMEFYGTAAGQIIGMFLFMVPFFVVFGKVTDRHLSRKQLAITIAVMVAVQLVIAAFIPAIVELYRNTGVGLGELLTQ